MMKHMIRRDPRPNAYRTGIDRFFDDAFFDPFFGLRGMQRMSPRMDIAETEKDITVSADVPGYAPADISVTVEDGVLTITGKAEEEKEEQQKRFHRRERYHGEFQRQIVLPGNIDQDHATCRVENGTLTIRIPKKEEQRNVKTLKVES